MKLSARDASGAPVVVTPYPAQYSSVNPAHACTRARRTLAAPLAIPRALDRGDRAGVADVEMIWPRANDRAVLLEERVRRKVLASVEREAGRVQARDTRQDRARVPVEGVKGREAVEHDGRAKGEKIEREGTCEGREERQRGSRGGEGRREQERRGKEDSGVSGQRTRLADVAGDVHGLRGPTMSSEAGAMRAHARLLRTLARRTDVSRRRP
jgi:hypothetical protein